MSLEFDPQKTIVKLTKFIKNEVKKAGFEKLVIGLSGGLDSSTVLTLAIRALGKNNVLAVILPYGGLNKKDVEDALLMINFLRIPSDNLFQVDIKSIVDSFVVLGKDTNQIRKGNIMVRTRMILLYDLAKKHQALVCGTENKSEHVLGYYTRFGDEASDLEPLRGFYKSQVKKLAKHLKIPEKIINKPPSAGLWQGQTDEKELGFSYDEADPILFYWFEKKFSWEEILQSGFDKELVEKVKKQVQQNEFKTKVPYLPKV